MKQSTINLSFLILGVVFFGIVAAYLGFYFAVNQDASPVDQDSSQIVADGCVRAGCSSQLCVETNLANDIMTTCEFREEYACYDLTVCERQASGECGFTQTEKLQNCLRDAGSPSLFITE
jgi:hypothetical protein